MSLVSLEELRGEVFLRYKAENRTLKDVMAYIEATCGAQYSEKQYRTKLKEWGFWKNNKRAILEMISRERANQSRGELQKIDYYVGQQLIDEEDVENYRRRYKTSRHGEDQQNIPGLLTSKIVRRLQPNPADITQISGAIEAPELILYATDSMIRKSFGTREWYFFDNERIIESSGQADVEIGRLMSLLSGVDLGCTFAHAGDFSTAFLHWSQASLQLEPLTKGKYHDIVPNLIRTLNDLLNHGFKDVAKLMVDHISQLSAMYLPGDYPVAAIFQHLGRVNPEDLWGLEVRLMSMYHELFEHHVGAKCYNTFALNLTAAKRTLERDNWTEIDKTLPALAPLEHTYGLANCRPLDVLRMKIEILYLRGQFQELIPIAQLLKNRADSKREDPWQRHYFMIKALYYGGRAHAHLGNSESARSWLREALFLEDTFASTVDGTGQFTSEKILMENILVELGN